VLTVRASSSSSSTQQHHIPKFSLNVESLGVKSTSYSNHTFSHYDYTISNGSIEYPEQTDTDLSPKYRPNEIVTFTVNTLPVIGKPLRVNITWMDIEKSMNCSYDSLLFLRPITTTAQKHLLGIFGLAFSGHRYNIADK
jgi:hypothetical protein